MGDAATRTPSWRRSAASNLIRRRSSTPQSSSRIRTTCATSISSCTRDSSMSSNAPRSSHWPAGFGAGGWMNSVQACFSVSAKPAANWT